MSQDSTITMLFLQSIFFYKILYGTSEWRIANEKFSNAISVELLFTKLISQIYDSYIILKENIIKIL